LKSWMLICSVALWTLSKKPFDIILVYSSTCISKIQKHLQDFFDGK
jgi:hypothetical protein